MSLRLACLLLLMFLGTAPLLAQDGPAPQRTKPVPSEAPQTKAKTKPLSLLQLVQIALTRNPQTRLALAQAKEAMADVGIAKSYYWPEVSFTGALTTSDQEKPEFPGITDITTYYKVGPELELYYLLLDFGGRDAYVAMMRELLTAAKFNQSQVMQDVILAVQSAYYNAMASEAQIFLALANLQYAQTQFDAQETALEAGLAIPADVLAAASALEEAKATMQSAQGFQAEAYAAVNVACGAPADAPLRLAPMPELKNLPELEKSVDTLIQNAFAARPDLAEQLALVRMKEDQVRQVESTYWPTVSLQADWYHHWFSARSTFTQSPTVDETEGVNFVSASIVIEWDLFDGFRRVNQVKAAEAQVEEEVAIFQQQKLDVSQQVWDAYYDYLTAGRNLNFRKAGLVSAEAQFDVVQEGLVTGLSDLLDFYQAEVTLAQARADLALSQASWYTASAQLIYTTGRLTPEALREAFRR